MKAFETRTIPAKVHGRYLVRPAAEEGPAPLLVGFHGYAESAEDHLDALLEIPGVSTWHAAAIQGLHPFYRNRTGEVVASWMTRLDRELAIADNVRYVGAVLKRLKRELKAVKPLVLVGFSQGTAMAYRAAAGSGVPCHGLIALAGDAPVDALQDPPDPFPRVLIARGTEDDWYDESKMERDLDLLEAAGAAVETLVFDGGHEWSPDFYQAAGRFLKELR